MSDHNEQVVEAWREWTAEFHRRYRGRFEMTAYAAFEAGWSAARGPEVLVTGGVTNTSWVDDTPVGSVAWADDTPVGATAESSEGTP